MPSRPLANEPTKRVRRTEPGRRDRIVDTTLKVISEHGLGSTTYRSIAVAADIPLGSITYHFSNLDELVTEAFTLYADRCADRFTSSMDRLPPDADLPKVLAGVVLSYLKSGNDTVLAYELYVGAIRNPSLRVVTNRWMRRSRDVLSRHMDDAMARMVDAMIEGLILHTYLEREPMSRAGLEDAFRRLLKKSVSSK